MKIVVVNNGFVFLCRDYVEQGPSVQLTAVRCIRSWGTDQGLGQLVSGPTKATVLDAQIPVVSVPMSQIVFSFDVTSTWERELT